MGITLIRRDKKRKVILWGGWYGSRNIGDQLLLLTITDLLDEMLDDVRYVVLTDNPDHVNAYTSRKSSSAITGLATRKQFVRVIREILSADVFVFGGAVPFFQQPKHLLAMIILVAVCKLGNTPYMTWSVSSQPVTSGLAKRVFKWVLQDAAAITYRDIHTRQLFEECGIKNAMWLTANSAFSISSKDCQHAMALLSRAGVRHTDRQLIAFTPRTLAGAENTNATHYSQQTINDYQHELECFSALVDWCWEHGYQPLFIPMNTYGDDDDRIAARACLKRSVHGQKALLIDEEVRPKDAPALYDQCAASFVARVHGSITSFIAECPVMMYAFQPKHSGIMAMMGLDEFNLIAEFATPQRAVELFQRLLTDREFTIERMRKKKVILNESAHIPAEIVKDIVEGNHKSE